MEANNKKIMIVDDEVDLANLFKSALEREGFKVLYSSDGETALQAAREFHPDLILLDIMMPRLSGFDAVDLFRNTLETSNARIVIFSALSQPDDIEKAKKLGADDYIVKSNASFEEVITKLKSLLQSQTSTKTA